MASFKEIVTKAIISKGKKVFTTNHVIKPNNEPSTILGCWVINHNFKGTKVGDKIQIEGSYDINIWYSYDNDKETEVIKQTNNYLETVNIRNNQPDDSVTNEEVIIRSLNQPTCSKVEIKDGAINYVIEKELGIELVGDTKVRISIDDKEDEWDEIIDESEFKEAASEIDNQVQNNDF